MAQKGVCPKCFKVHKLTKHHVLPKRFFGFNHNVLHLCRDCHDEIDTLIPQYTKMEEDFYFKITLKWLRGMFPKIKIE